MAIVADFRTRFPEFANVVDARIQMFMDDAALLMESPERWLSFYDVAHVYYAAHMLVVGTTQELGDTGILSPVRKQEVDDVMIEQAIADVTAIQDELLSTSYGKRFWGYRKICFTGIIGV